MSDKKVAVAFGGGGARGISHIWIMEALDELGVKPVALSGTSIGALAAVCYASGYSGVDLRAYMLDLFGNTGKVLSRFLETPPTQLLTALFGAKSHGQLEPVRSGLDGRKLYATRYQKGFQRP